MSVAAWSILTRTTFTPHLKVFPPPAKRSTGPLLGRSQPRLLMRQGAGHLGKLATLVSWGLEGILWNSKAPKSGAHDYRHLLLSYNENPNQNIYIDTWGLILPCPSLASDSLARSRRNSIPWLQPNLLGSPACTLALAKITSHMRATAMQVSQSSGCAQTSMLRITGRVKAPTRQLPAKLPMREPCQASKC